jgi:hypothetical protein
MENITTYFGLVSSATGSHKAVYSKMQDLDEWRTRDLPPGFHP